MLILSFYSYAAVARRESQKINDSIILQNIAQYKTYAQFTIKNIKFNIFQKNYTQNKKRRYLCSFR